MRKVCTAVSAALFGFAVNMPAMAWEPDPIQWSHLDANGIPQWYKRGEADGVWKLTGSYTSLHRIKRYPTRVDSPMMSVIYTNETLTPTFACPGYTCPGIMRYTGVGTSFIEVNLPTVVAPNTIINDVFDPATGALAPKRFFTRPHVVHPKGPEWYTTSYVANDYPPTDGNVVPAFLHSSDGKVWVYDGIFGGEVGEWLRTHKSWGSSMAHYAKPGIIPLNHVTPSANKHFMIADALGGRNLVAIYSADGRDWYFARDASGQIIDVLAPELIARNAGKIFASMVYVPKTKGYLMVVTDQWPPTNVFVEYSCNGINWRVLGDPSKKSVLVPPFGSKNVSFGPYVNGDVVHVLANDNALMNIPITSDPNGPKMHNVKRWFTGKVPASLNCF